MAINSVQTGLLVSSREYSPIEHINFLFPGPRKQSGSVSPFAKGFYICTSLTSVTHEVAGKEAHMDDEGTDIRDRLGKLDSLLLWVASLSSLGFSLFIAYLKVPLVPYIPIFALIGFSIIVGYVNGAILSNSFTERIRGWNYLLLGLSFYVPSVVVKFGEPYFLTLYSDFSKVVPYLQLLLGLFIPLAYVLLNKKWAIPKIYRSFNIGVGEVTNKILARTFFASIYLGGTLYILALALYETKTDPLSITLYTLFFILFTDLLVSEEIKIRTLRRLEKYQQFLTFQSIIDKKLHKVSFAFIVIGVVAFVVVWSFSTLVPLYLLMLSFLLAFSLPVLGFVFLALFVYKEDRVELNEQAGTDLSGKQLSELRSLLSKKTNRDSTALRETSIGSNIRGATGSRFVGRHFCAIAFLVGLLVTSIAGGGLFATYQCGTSHVARSDLQGFAIAHNSTQNILPRSLYVRVVVFTDRPILYFRYAYVAYENGSYNFIFVFPFQVVQNTGMNEAVHFNSTPYGSAIWTTREINNVANGSWSDDYFEAEFFIDNTFQSGTRGDYTFTLPFIGGVGGASDVITQLQDSLNVTWYTDAEVELEFIVPSRLHITQAYPQSFAGPDTLTIIGNQTINKVRWTMAWPSQQFTIICHDSDEASFYQDMLFFSGIFISIGASIVVRSAYDAAKKNAGQMSETIHPLALLLV